MVKVHVVRSENFMQICIIPYTHAGFLRSKDALRSLDNIQLSWVLAGHLTRGNYRLAPFDLRPGERRTGPPGAIPAAVGPIAPHSAAGHELRHPLMPVIAG